MSAYFQNTFSLEHLWTVASGNAWSWRNNNDIRFFLLFFFSKFEFDPKDTENIIKISQTNYAVTCKIAYIILSILGRIGGWERLHLENIPVFKIFTCMRNFWRFATICTLLKTRKIPREKCQFLYQI